MNYRIEPYSPDRDMDWFISMQFESMRENNALDLRKTRNVPVEEHRTELLKLIQSKKDNEILICKQEQLNKRIGYIWIAERGYCDPWDFNSLPAWVYDVRVSPQFRGQGLGKALIAAGCNWAKNNGFERIGLHVLGENHIAIHLYQVLGFETGHCYLQKRIPKTPDSSHAPSNHYSVRRFNGKNDPTSLLTLWYQNFKTRITPDIQIPEEHIQQRFKEFSENSPFDRRGTETFIATSNGGTPAGFVQIYQSKGDPGENEYTWMWTPEISPTHPKNEVVESLLSQVEDWTRDHSLETIRTGPYIGSDLRDWLDNRGYQTTNIFMFSKL